MAINSSVACTRAAGSVHPRRASVTPGEARRSANASRRTEERMLPPARLRCSSASLTAAVPDPSEQRDDDEYDNQDPKPSRICPPCPVSSPRLRALKRPSLTCPAVCQCARPASPLHTNLNEGRAAVFETEDAGRGEEGEHPELDRAYDREEGGQVPEQQDRDDGYSGPDPGQDRTGDGDDEDQGI
jgi:hypothetical protein